MIVSATLLKDLQKRVTLLEEDLRRRCDADPQVNAPLQTQYATARESKRTAETFNAWRDEQITQIAVAWVLACVFVRFLEDNQLLDTPFLAGPDAARMNRARDEQELFFKQHPTASERDYLLHVFDTVGQLPGMREFFDRRHNPLWLAGPTGDALASLLDFWRKTNPDTGALIHDFADPVLVSAPCASAPLCLGVEPGGSESTQRREVAKTPSPGSKPLLAEPDQSPDPQLPAASSDPTRFLGDLYQDLSEAARKRFALLQTPVFVEEFILDRTLTPAIETFGYKAVRMIDPTCGSGHFCLGGFQRLFRLWQEGNPGENPRVLAQRALDGVYGVDLNPYAVAIAKFRLLLAALQVSGINKLKNAPDFRIHLAAGDSLLHGRRFREFESQTGPQRTFDTGDEVFRDELKHHYEVEDVEALHRILGQQYHAVVGNPPYITVQDKAVSELYRARYSSCHREYSLSVPFMERFFDLAVKGEGTPKQPAGFVGQITSNSFMKRVFGKKLIEEHLPRWNLTHVLDTSGAYIPGHGTPTLILLGKNQSPVGGTIRTVLGIRNEPTKPDNPALGLVWQAMIRQIDSPGSVSEWVSAADSIEARFHKHPWCIGGGGAAELTQELEISARSTLGDHSRAIGFLGMTHADDVMLASAAEFRRRRVENGVLQPLVIGELVRDWLVIDTEHVLFPYAGGLLHSLTNYPGLHCWLWPTRTTLGNRATFGKTTYFAERRPWWSWHQIALDRLEPPMSITFAFVATNNHFALDLGGRVFRQSSPIIKLKPEATEEEHVRLTGVLNSSSACFWLRQVCHNKGRPGAETAGADERYEQRFEFDNTKIASLPIPSWQPSQLPTALVKYSTAMRGLSPAATLASWGAPEDTALRERLVSARELARSHRRKLIAWQEELDWQNYEAFGLVASAEAPARQVSLPEGVAVDAIPPGGIELGQRAFEIVLARRMAAGKVQTTWFERHGSTPTTEVPRHWPAPYRELVERRIARIESDPNIRLIEQPEYKRRWNTEPWDEQQNRALRQWLLNRLEGYFFEGERMMTDRPTSPPVCAEASAGRQPSPPLRGGEGEPSASPGATNAAQPLDPADRAPRDPLSLSRGEGRGEGCREAGDRLVNLRLSWPAGQKPTLISTNQLAEVVQADAAFLQVAEVYHGAPGFSVPKLVRELVESESVPFLPFQRYKESGLRKRQDWERTWDLQRQEDAIDVQEKVDEKGITDAERQRRQIEAAARKKGEIGEIPVPPKYTSADFRSSAFWRLRGKLDVPKERWVSYPGVGRDGDPSPVIAWAGWNHLQQAQALAEYYLTAKDTWGWPSERLILLLAGLADLLPWLKQWYNDLNPEYGMGLGDYFAGFVDEEARKQGATGERLNALRLGV